jgi:hypothetical protein
VFPIGLALIDGQRERGHVTLHVLVLFHWGRRSYQAPRRQVHRNRAPQGDKRLICARCGAVPGSEADQMEPSIPFSIHPSSIVAKAPPSTA